MYKFVNRVDPLLRKNILLTLDGFRGIAALAVAVRHVPEFWGGSSPQGFMFESYLAVDLFFILSGFVLAHAYADALREHMQFGQFAALRLVRIFPLYLLSVLISAVLDVLGRAYHGQASLISWDLLRSLLMLPNVGEPQGYMFPLNVPA